MNILTNVTDFLPRTWRKRRETEAETEAKMQTTVRMVPELAKELITNGLPKDAAWDAALQIGGVANTESVLNRLSPDDWAKLPAALGASETLVPAIHATRTASSEELRDLLARIIKGELDNPSTPRSSVEIANGLNREDLESFLLLRRVLWDEYVSDALDPVPALYCMEQPLEYPGLLSAKQINRLVDLRLVKFGAVPFQSHFPGPIAVKAMGFGNKLIRVYSTKPDATMFLGHLALTSDGNHIISLFRDDPCEMAYASYEAACDCWKEQGFNVLEASPGSLMATHPRPV